MLDKKIMIDKEIEVKNYEKIDIIKMYLNLYNNHIMSKKTMIGKVDLGDNEIIKGYKLDTILMYLDLYHNQIISSKRMMKEAGLNYDEEVKQLGKESEENRIKNIKREKEKKKIGKL